MKPLAIYIHVPFCVRKCVYCDFASFAGCEDVWDDYFSVLCDEIDSWRDVLSERELHSIYFGGGTPSLVPAEYIASVLDKLRMLSNFSEDCEITLEVNPGTLSPEKLEIYRHTGANRISLGAQSFDAGLLQMLGRIHTPQQIVEAVCMVRDAGFVNINLDLMYALPGQTMEQWEETLKQALGLPLTHISAYSLIVEPGTELALRVGVGEIRIPGDDTVNAMQRCAVQRLEAAGFGRYEISNFARTGFECHHNLTYWFGGDYLGMGSAAHSLLDERRFSNPPELKRYIKGERQCDMYVRSEEDRRDEMLMLATRTTRGLDLALWREEFGEDFVTQHSTQILKLESLGLVELTDGCLRLTPTGLELQDAVVLELC